MSSTGLWHRFLRIEIGGDGAFSSSTWVGNALRTVTVLDSGSAESKLERSSSLIGFLRYICSGQAMPRDD